MLTCDMNKQEKKNPAFLNTPEIPWLHQVTETELLHASHFLETLAVLSIPTAQGTVTLKRRILVRKQSFRHSTSLPDQAWKPEYCYGLPTSLTECGRSLIFWAQ